jgi:hypothetical protein
MIYAFDWGGVLSENLELVEIARSLLSQGHEVHIISVAWPRENRREHMRDWQRRNFWFTEVHVILETGNTQHGEEKVKIMKEIGCRVIFDDNQDVINHAKAADFLALKVPTRITNGLLV